ncbi:hypothetical protein F2Q68_00036549 [Brassica cretica]|uniref:LIM zinc-binding domain-containing protein n=1 Tax=Brassica cretica TaxID=69181 RepID=A0A8S9GYN1_BRACR|nr:hypothetical protein F2Q68_00036549 [Brassica cretica]
MPISDVASLVGGAVLGAPFSEMFKQAIEGAKKVKEFKSLFEDLASTMERLVPIINDIISMLGRSTHELEFLINTVQRAEEMVSKCSRVQWYNIADKVLYTRKIQGITRDVLKFSQVDLQFILLREQQHFRRSLEGNCSICEGCNSVIEDGCVVNNVLGVLWHPDCFCCDACHKPISTDEIGNHHVRKIYF